MAAQEESYRLYRVSKTLKTLVYDRGYAMSAEERDQSLEAFRNEHASGGYVDRAKLNFYAAKAENAEDKIYVFYAQEKSVGISTMRKFIGILDERNVGRGILVYHSNITPAANKGIALDFDIQTFQENELLVNITKHQLVPQHEVLDLEQKKELLLRYRLKETQLPRIMSSDPVARYYGLKRGQVVKITRPSETAGRYTSFRICF